MGQITKFRWSSLEERFARTLQSDYKRKFGRELGWSKLIHLALTKIMDDSEWDPVLEKRDSYEKTKKKLGLKQDRKRPSSS